MKSKTTIITEEFNEDGKLISRTTETREEEDNGYINPQYPYNPPWVKPVEITCNVPSIPTTEEVKETIQEWLSQESEKPRDFERNKYE